MIETQQTSGWLNPAFNDRLVASYETLLSPILFDPYAVHMVEYAARSRPANILEVAAGTGVLTRALRSRMPTAEIVATDISPAMAAEGRRATEGSEIHWMEADAGKLPFGPQMFDLVVSQFGVMFYQNKVAAFREAARVLRKNGRFLFCTWDWLHDNDFARAVDEALARLFPADPPSFLRRLPYSYYDQDVIRAQMSAAGFSAVSCDRVELTSTAPDAGTIAAAFCEGTPLRSEIEERSPGLLFETVAAVEKVIRADLAARPEGAMTALLVLGTAA